MDNGSFGVVRSRTLADASLHEEPLRPFGAPPPLRWRGFEWLPCEGELSAKLTEGFFQRCVSELRESCGSPYSAFVCLFESRTTANEPRGTARSSFLFIMQDADFRRMVDGLFEFILDFLARSAIEFADDVDGDEREEESRYDFVKAEPGELFPNEDG